MRTFGGVDCTEEFGLFLSARPEYSAFELPVGEGVPPGVERFVCSSGSFRYYTVPSSVPDCDLAFAEFLADNPQFMAGVAPPDGLRNPRVQPFVCPQSGLFRWFGWSLEGAYAELLRYVSFVGDIDAFTPEGQAFYESERLAGESIDDYYRRGAYAQYYTGRIFTADGRYFSYVRKGSRYHLEYPEYILVI